MESAPVNQASPSVLISVLEGVLENAPRDQSIGLLVAHIENYDRLVSAFGYRVGRPVALAEVKAEIGDDDSVEVDIARTLWSGRVSMRPAYDPEGARMRLTKT